MSWTLVVVLSAAAYGFKASGLFALRGRTMPAGLLRCVELLAPALFTALIVVQTFGGEAGVVVDARAVGLAVAAAAVWRGAPFLAVVLVGAATTALLRAVV